MLFTDKRTGTATSRRCIPIKVPPTLEGKNKFEIPEGTQTDTSFTLRGKGIPVMRSQNRRGDLIVTVKVEIPRGLSEKQKNAMKAFAESCGESNYSKRSGFFKRIFDKK